jgi:hypothetical protein
MVTSVDRLLEVFWSAPAFSATRCIKSPPKRATTLFALFKREDAPGTWDLVVSAPWIESGKLKATSEFVSLLADSIGTASLEQFARVQTVSADSPAVKFILANLPVDDGELRVESTDLFGLEIDEAIIFRAKRSDSRKNSRKTLQPTAAGSRGR